MGWLHKNSTSRLGLLKDGRVSRGIRGSNHIPALLTEFEIEVERLELAQPEYLYSRELKRGCDRNRNRAYVPEWLLKQWGCRWK